MWQDTFLFDQNIPEVKYMKSDGKNELDKPPLCDKALPKPQKHNAMTTHLSGMDLIVFMDVLSKMVLTITNCTRKSLEKHRHTRNTYGISKQQIRGEMNDRDEGIVNEQPFVQSLKMLSQVMGSHATHLSAISVVPPEMPNYSFM